MRMRRRSGMAGEEDAVEVVGLALEPVGARENAGDRRHRRRPRRSSTLTRMRDVLARAEQVIDDVEALLALRPVDAADVDEVDEGEPRIVAQELRRTATISPPATVTVSSPKAIVPFESPPPSAPRRCIRRAPSASRPCDARPVAAYRSIVPVRRIFFCSSSTP